MVVTVVGTTVTPTEEKSNKRSMCGFVDEMRAVAMRMHTIDQSIKGEKETEGKPWPKWEPTIDGYLKFLVDSKHVYDTFNKILDQADFPEYSEFRNTGLDRAGNLMKDLAWFKEKGHYVPEPLSLGIDYSLYIKELSKKDTQAFICHFYNTYFAHTEGGRMIGRKVAAKILNGKELDFYKWDGDLPQLLQNVRDSLNKVAQEWTRDEKNHCLEETKKSFKFNSDIIHLILA